MCICMSVHDLHMHACEGYVLLCAYSHACVCVCECIIGWKCGAYVHMYMFVYKRVVCMHMWVYIGCVHI